MEPYLARIQVYVGSLTGHWKLLLAIFSVASLAYTVHVYNQGAAQTIQPDEYMKGGANNPGGWALRLDKDDTPSRDSRDTNPDTILLRGELGVDSENT
jgi:hypothetical protein